MSTIAIVCYCPRCDYFIKTAVMPGSVGSHGCAQCDGWMEVYVAQGSREAVEWHRERISSPTNQEPHAQR